jgi:predicted small metal-binding protein
MIRANGVRIVLLTNAVPAMGRSGEGGEMRAFDCSDPSHGKVHFTGKDDDDLVQTIKAHAATAHPDLTEGQIREMVAGADWWKEMATSGVNAGSAQSAYDE